MQNCKFIFLLTLDFIILYFIGWGFPVVDSVFCKEMFSWWGGNIYFKLFMYLHTCVCVHVFVYPYMCACMCTCLYVHMSTYKYSQKLLTDVFLYHVSSYFRDSISHWTWDTLFFLDWLASELQVSTHLYTQDTSSALYGCQRPEQILYITPDQDDLMPLNF